MQGIDLARWRERNGYTQSELMKELEIKSRQTISSLERPDRKVPRLVELALIALEEHPACRLRAGKRATASQARQFVKEASS